MTTRGAIGKVNDTAFQSKRLCIHSGAFDWRFDCSANIARFHHPRPDSIVMVVASSGVHHWMPFLKAGRDIKYVCRKIRRRNIASAATTRAISAAIS
jgi:hypothetical protein